MEERLADNGGGDSVVIDEQLVSEEDEAEFDASVSTSAEAPVTIKLSGRAVPDRAVVAQVRLAMKTKERGGAKKQRVKRAVQRRTTSQIGVDEIELAVGQMDSECRERRQQQADEAQNELEERRKRQ
ncbi:unnamed protein product [Phytophthora fragariaefolia]|uniref:Unnamed protein product n=1 Tax=Phytophthora fragariaefolia TaxID=1490495 RepID=A0A9W6XXK6_9STRA|nr:unnamed protein product [Phytophthora fragariaefolia]